MYRKKKWRFFRIQWLQLGFVLTNFAVTLWSILCYICISVNESRSDLIQNWIPTRRSGAVDVLNSSTFYDCQTVYEGEIWCLCTVTCGQKSSKLNSIPVYCSQLYGILIVDIIIIRTITILQIHRKMLLHHFDMGCILPYHYVPQLENHQKLQDLQGQLIRMKHSSQNFL